MKGNWDTASIKKWIFNYATNILKTSLKILSLDLVGLGTWFKINPITYNKEYNSQSSFTTILSSEVLKILALDKSKPKVKIRFTYNPPPFFCL